MGFTNLEILPLLGRVAGAAQQALSDLDRTGQVLPYTKQLLRGALASYRSALELSEAQAKRDVLPFVTESAS